MNWGPVLLCSWPGLAGLWCRGYLSSLLIAIGFSIILNLAMISTFVWPWSMGETFPLVSWPVILLVWITSAWLTYKQVPDLVSVSTIATPEEPQQGDTLFIQAQSEYLKGHWSEAEFLLHRCLRNWPRDIEARLLLATLHRHNRRLEDAANELDNLLKYDESTNWISEIRREKKLIGLIAEHQQSEQRGEPERKDERDMLPADEDGFVTA